MKIIVERDRLKDAIAAVMSRAKRAHTIPILSHLLLEANSASLRLLGHDLDACSATAISAECQTSGSIAIPCERFNRLVSGLPSGSQIMLATMDKDRASLKCGRSSYEFSLLPTDDFPSALEPKEPVKFNLSGKDVAKLFGVPAPCVNTDKNRIFLAGVFLHKRGAQLASCATDGHTLAHVLLDAAVPDFAGVIVPTISCADFVDLAGKDGEVSVEVSKSLIAMQRGEARIVSKLIDGEFPDYQCVIPQKTAPALTVDCEELESALQRIIAANDENGRYDAIKLSWNDNPERLRISKRSATAAGEEEISCESEQRDAGEVGLQGHYLQRLIGVTGGETLKLYIAGPRDPLRMENPLDQTVTAVCMPCKV